MGRLLQIKTWETRWTDFFKRLLTTFYHYDQHRHGHWSALHQQFERTLSHLVPRLIGIMETDGRSLPSCLMHGDLWDGNVATEAATGDPWIFDCAVYYAHHEMKLASWQPPYHELSEPLYREAYWR